LRDFLEANGNLLAKGEDELIIYPTADTNWFSIDFLANTLLITESENLDNCDVEFRINNYIYLSLDISQGCKDRENRLIEIEKSVYTLEPTILLGENLVYSSQENNQTFQSKDLLLFVDGAHSGIYITFSNGDLSARIPKLNPEQYQSLIIRSGRADIQISDISGTLTMGKNQYTVTEYSLLEAGISSIDEFYYSFPSTNDQSILGAEARLLLRGIAKKITLNKESVIPAVGNNRQELTIQTLNSIISIIITVLVAGAIESTPKESSDLSKLENKDDKERIEK
jgi:hypothetical protein